MRWFLLAVPMLALAASPSAAGFRAHGQLLEIRDGQQFFFSPYDVTGAVQAGDGKTGVETAATSLADLGGLRASASAAIRENNANQPLNADVSRSAIAAAIGTYQVTVTGPSGPVAVSFDMELGGSLEVVSANTLVDLNAANAAISVNLRVDGILLTDAQGNTNGIGISSTAGGADQVNALGALAAWTSPLGVITSPSFMVEAGTPFMLEIELVAIAGANADATENAFVAESNSDFGSTLRFPTGVPIFDLPAGYSVSSPDAGIVDNQLPCTSNCTRFQSKCDAGKIGCVAKRQACVLKVHAAAEKSGEAPDADALQKCLDSFGACLGKLEARQNAAKPKTLCTVTGDLVDLTLAGDAFVTDVATTIDPSFPSVGPPSTCDGGKQTCVLRRAACLLKLAAAATKKAILVEPGAMQRCADRFDGGAKGFARGCVGKLQEKQSPESPKTSCAVTDDGTALETAVDTFVDDTLSAVLGLE